MGNWYFERIYARPTLLYKYKVVYEYQLLFCTYFEWSVFLFYFQCLTSTNNIIIIKEHNKENMWIRMCGAFRCLPLTYCFNYFMRDVLCFRQKLSALSYMFNVHLKCFKLKFRIELQITPPSGRNYNFFSLTLNSQRLEIRN